MEVQYESAVASIKVDELERLVRGQWGELGLMILDTFLLLLNGFFATGGVVKHEIQSQTGAR
jgi:hypothetical protein